MKVSWEYHSKYMEKYKMFQTTNQMILFVVFVSESFSSAFCHLGMCHIVLPCPLIFLRRECQAANKERIET